MYRPWKPPDLMSVIIVPDFAHKSVNWSRIGNVERVPCGKIRCSIGYNCTLLTKAKFPYLQSQNVLMAVWIYRSSLNAEWWSRNAVRATTSIMMTTGNHAPVGRTWPICSVCQLRHQASKIWHSVSGWSSRM
jgi:hypothetical protein